MLLAFVFGALDGSIELLKMFLICLLSLMFHLSHMGKFNLRQHLLLIYFPELLFLLQFVRRHLAILQFMVQFHFFELDLLMKVHSGFQVYLVPALEFVN